MSESRHTPGPWHLVGDSLCRTESGEPWAVVQAGGAAIDIIAPGCMEDDHMANARLMAGAPAMYALLKRLVEFKGDWPDVVDLSDDAGTILAEIETGAP